MGGNLSYSMCGCNPEETRGEDSLHGRHTTTSLSQLPFISLSREASPAPPPNKKVPLASQSSTEGSRSNLDVKNLTVRPQQEMVQPSKQDSNNTQHQWKWKTKEQQKIQTNQAATKAIKAPSSNNEPENPQSQSRSQSQSQSQSQSRSIEHEPSISLSLQERLQLYQSDINFVKTKEQDRVLQHKQSHNINNIELTDDKKKLISEQFEKMITLQKSGGLLPENNNDAGNRNNTIVNEGNTNSDTNNANKSIDNTSDNNNPNPKKSRNIGEILKNGTNEQALLIVEELGFIQQQGNFEIFNMNNSGILKKLTDEQKNKLEDIISYSIGNNPKLLIVQMCNANMDDKFLKKILSSLLLYKDYNQVKELWFESNFIGDSGMEELSSFLKKDNKITVIKLYNNKIDITPKICDKLIEGLEINTTVIKFIFEFRFQQHKDGLNKALKKNQDIARKLRNENSKSDK